MLKAAVLTPRCPNKSPRVGKTASSVIACRHRGMTRSTFQLTCAVLSQLDLKFARSAKSFGQLSFVVNTNLIVSNSPTVEVSLSGCVRGADSLSRLSPVRMWRPVPAVHVTDRLRTLTHFLLGPPFGLCFAV